MTDLVEAVARAMWEDWRTNCKTAKEGARGCSWELLKANIDRPAIADIVSDGLSQARAALAAIEGAGYRVVPVEVTDEMEVAADVMLHDWVCAQQCWDAMLAAAPKVTP